MNEARFPRRGNFAGVGLIGEDKRVIRARIRPAGSRGANSVTVGRCLGDRGDRRLQVGMTMARANWRRYGRRRQPERRRRADAGASRQGGG